MFEGKLNSHFGFGVRVVLLIGAELPRASGGDVGRDEGALVLARRRGSGRFGGYCWHPGTEFDSGLRAVIRESGRQVIKWIGI